MRILVVSDTHGDTATLKSLIGGPHGAGALFFLGDGLADLSRCRHLFGGHVFAVRGNCDFNRDTDADGFTTFLGNRIFYTHGHGYEVKMGYQPIKKAAMQRAAGIVLCGHTHVPYLEYDNGLYLFNPGALCGGRGMAKSYGIIEIEENSGRPLFYHREV